MNKNLLLYGAKLDSKKLGTALEHVFKTNLALQNTGKRGTPICIWGTHGLGKTMLVQEFAKKKQMAFSILCACSV
jgi:predicted ATPase